MAVTQLHRIGPRTVTIPSKVKFREVLLVCGDVEFHGENQATVTPRSRNMLLLLEGLMAYWKRREADGWRPKVVR